MTVQFIMVMEWLKWNALLLYHVKGLFYFLSSMDVMLSGKPVIKVKCVLYEWRLMLCSLLYSPKQVSFKPFSVVCLTSLPQCPDFLHPLPQGCLTFLPKLLSSLLCQNWQIIFHPNALNQQWHFLQCGFIFLFQELPVTPSHSLGHLYHNTSMFSSNVPHCSTVLPLSPEVLQPSPALCSFF